MHDGRGATAASNAINGAGARDIRSGRAEVTIGQRSEAGVRARGRLAAFVGVAARTARKELRQWRRDRYVAGAVLVIAGLLAISAAAGAWAGARLGQANSRAQQAEYARWLAQPARDPHSASHFGMSLFHTPSRLALVDPGVVSYAGATIFLEAHKQNQPAYPKAADTGSAARLGQLHLAAAIGIWLPLVIIVLSAGAFAAEREDGTLAQLLSLGAPPAALAAGKALATLAIAAAVTLPAAIVAGAWILWAPDAGPRPGDLPLRLIVLGLGYAGYAVLWTILTVTVSATVRSSRLAAAVLVALWCLTTIVAPRAAIDRARISHQLPSRATVERQILEERIARGKNAAKDRQALLRKYNVTDEKDLPIDIGVLRAMQSEERTNAMIDRYAARLEEVFLAERGAYLRAAWLSPAIALDVLSMAAAGADDWHYRAFLKQAEDYRRAMIRLLNNAMIRRPGERRTSGDAALWAKLPPFAFDVPRMSAMPAPLTQAGGALAVWLAIMVGAAALSIRRLSPR
jgi:ABC-2 type transport system permease protein